VSDWIWFVAMLFMGWFGFVFGVKYALPRRKIHPFLWGMMNPFGQPYPWWDDDRREGWVNQHGKPWET
jgi:hypothetical protein